MDNYHKIINSNTNYALYPNIYLDQLQTEPDRKKKFNILKKYFTETITKQLYQNMDLLHSTNMDYEQFKDIYLLIAKDLFMNVLLALDILATEHCAARSKEISNSIVPITNKKRYNEYTICESYIKSQK